MNNLNNIDLKLSHLENNLFPVDSTNKIIIGNNLYSNDYYIQESPSRIKIPGGGSGYIGDIVPSDNGFWLLLLFIGIYLITVTLLRNK